MKYSHSLRYRTTGKPIVLYDRWLLFAAVSLLIVGLLMVASSSIVIAYQQTGHGFYYFFRQIVHVLAGIGLGLWVIRVDIDRWQQVSAWLLLAAVGLLVLILVPGIGRTVNGSTRWLALGPVSLQVSEFVKLAMIIYVAGYFVRHQQQVQETFMGFLKPLLLVGIVTLLLLQQPDFGAAMVMILTVLGMLFLVGTRLWQFALLAGLAAGSMSILAVTSPYRMARLTGFLDPWADQFNSGYQLTQSLIAFGRGGWFGTGLGESVQKLFYLPEAHTDFIFAVLAEELGLMGVLTVIALYGLLIWRALILGRRSVCHRDIFAGFLAYGIALWLGIQTMINMGVCVGLLPTKGLTLPLLSYGGSSMLVICVAIALLLRIDHELRWKRYIP